VVPHPRATPPGRAKAIFRTCPAREECSDYALSHPSLEGIWAGTTGNHRRRLRRDTKSPGLDRLTALVLQLVGAGKRVSLELDWVTVVAEGTRVDVSAQPSEVSSIPVRILVDVRYNP